jgi:plastocyanin
MRRKRVGVGWTVAALLSLAAAPVPAATVTGTVHFEGKIPKLKRQDMRADPGCVAKHKTPPESELLVLGEGNTLGNVFAWIESGLPGVEYPVPAEPVVLDQKGCVFIPRVSGVMVGQPFKILNNDSLMHNVHSLSKVNMPFNLAMPGSLKDIEMVFTAEEWMFQVKCDVHPWMKGYVSVLKHPFYDATEPDGKFEISGLPAGTFEVEIWHETLGTQAVEVTLDANDVKHVEFTLSPPSKKKKPR